MIFSSMHLCGVPRRIIVARYNGNDDFTARLVLRVEEAEVTITGTHADLLDLVERMRSALDLPRQEVAA